MTKLPSDKDLSGAEAVCPHCGSVFSKRRKDQRYCRPACRKDRYQKKDRAKTPVNSANRYDKRRGNLEFFDRALRLAETLYMDLPWKSGEHQLRNQEVFYVQRETTDAGISA